MSKKHGRENDSVEVIEEVKASEVALREESMQAFWEENDIFKKSVARPAGAEPQGDFIFYDGPPFATGLPHYGHLLAGTIKDAIPRFWTMNGKRVERRWGWDCHGLPVENLIEKKLGLANKKDIEDYGIANFNEQARESVLEYADDWREIIPRMGRFVDMEDDYRTMDSSYTERVWWVFKSLFDKGLVNECFKTMHFCTRCGTTLSNFEVNQGYKDIKDIAVTVKLPLLDESGEATDTSLLVWTTTPWTLPGNLAAAVHNEIEYVKVSVETDAGEDKVILAKGRLAQLGDTPYTELETMTGSDLVGCRYQPPFDYLQKQNIDGAEKAWTIYHADFVEVGEEGTGGVHIAPAFGDDDMQLAQANNIPIAHHVDETGHFKDWVEEFAGRLVKPKDDPESGIDHKDADIEILRHLQGKELIFKKENISHSYPHCWRCETPLLNYATTSWFVNVPSIKEDLLEQNNTVNWVPEYVGKNRFGKWLEGARDWAVSRQRYWGAPIPIWKNPETGQYKVFGSLAELQEYVPKSGNEYFVMRHGQAESNVNSVVSSNKNTVDGLTEIGREQVAAALENLPEKIDLIVHSGYQRTRETAELVAKHYPEATVLESDLIGEFALTDEFEGKPWSTYSEQFPDWEDRYTKELEGSENRLDVKRRMGDFMYGLEKDYSGKTILILSHGGSIAALHEAVMGMNPDEAEKYHDDVRYFANAQVAPLNFTALPHNPKYELDFHRPYIDEIALYEDGVQLERVPDVFDCWFESGSMPYAAKTNAQSQLDKDRTITVADEHKPFPAHFIAEGLDQTRGWFYSMLVLGTALFGKTPYENVIVNGLVLAEDGKKMSKSLNNYPDPIELVKEAGADSVRFYLMSSGVMRGEDLSFSKKEVMELQRKNIGRLHNVLAMYEMFADGTSAAADSTQVLDRWVLARLNQLIEEVTTGFNNYELDKATRPITDFIDDVSVWYLRRSRDRLKGEDLIDKTRSLATLRYTLRTLALIIAPAMPFYAEYLWQQVKEDDDVESVHLAAWPQAEKVDNVVIGEMSMVREFVTLALEARTKAGSKVRQPLAALSLNVEMTDEYTDVIADEVNVKQVHYDPNLKERAQLDTKLTPELIAEGAVRELMRAIQGKRKKEGLQPEDRITLTIDTTTDGEAAVNQHQDLLVKTVGATSVTYTTVSDGEEIAADSFTFRFDFTIV